MLWSIIIQGLTLNAINHARIQRGTEGPEPPEKKGFLRNTGPDPLKIKKLPRQHSMLGHYQPASKTPFQ